MRYTAFLYTVSFLGLAACTPTVDLRGHAISAQMLQQVIVGQTTEDQVQIILGSPSTSTNFGSPVWHYVFERTETVSFMDPKVKEYKVITIAFDKSGKVSEISQLSDDALTKVDLVTRTTPTAGKEMSVLEQLVGNVGRFAKDPKTK